MSDAKGLDGESRSIPPRPPAPQGSGSGALSMETPAPTSQAPPVQVYPAPKASGGDEDHKEDAANYVLGGMRCGKTLVMENAKLKAEVKKLKEDLSASEANIATLESEDTDAMKERDRLFTETHVNERLIKQFCEAALTPAELNTTTPERAVEVVADMRKRRADVDAEVHRAAPLLDAVADVLKTHGPRRRDEAVAPAMHRAGAHLVALEVLRTRAEEWQAGTPKARGDS